MLATFVAHGVAEQAGDNAPPLTLHTLFTQWEFAPVVTVLLAITAVGYLVCVWRVRRDHPARPWSPVRTASFMAGLGVIAIATQSSIGAYDDVLFSMHMWQHLLMLMVTPPLLLAGHPVTLLLHASRNPVHTWVKRAVRSKVASVLTFPLVGLVLYTTVVVGTHLTSFMDLSLTHPALHQAEHVLYLVAGYLYFLPLVGHEPIRWRLSFPAQLFLLAVVMPVDTFTGVVLTQTDHVMFPAYEGRRDWGPSLIGDLHDGGAIMWIAGDGIMFVLILLLFVSVLRGRLQIDAGRWVEGVRARRFTELAASGSAMVVDTADIDAASGSRRDATTTDEDDRHLDAYNDYLARLNGDHGSPAGNTP
jgi:cytochrome c oxidase assembly factor CtaG